MNPENVVEIAEEFHETYDSQISGTRDPEWGIIRTIISQNTNSDNTRRGFDRLKNRFPTLEDVAEAPEDELAEALQPAGLHNQKAGRIKTVARWIRSRGGLDDLMTDKEEARETIMELPGVGPKTADVTLAFSAGLPIVPVDTHVFRVTKRLGVAPEDADYDEVRESWESVLPDRLMPHVHVDLIRHGREACNARKPRCGDCPVNELCKWPEKEEHGYDQSS